MNKVENRMRELEEEYFAQFCQKEEEGILVRYRDDKIPDMHTHNFTWIKETMGPDELNAIIEKEIQARKKQGHKFLQLRLDWIVQKEDLPTDKENKHSLMEYYQITPRAIPFMKERDDVEVIKLSELLIEEAKELDEICEEAEALNFTNRRFDRRSEVYLKEGGVDNYLALLEWDAVGACDYFASKGTCMLEDFVVDPEVRGEGIGTTILKTLAQMAFKDGNDLVFLTADANETAHEMYQKLSFEKIWTITQILFKF